MRDSEIIAMLKNDCPMCGPADCACTATEQDQYREIQRLRLTDEEREAIELSAGDYLYHQDAGGRAQWIRKTLLGLLERLK
jgi:hypothetical protein